jgi:hypothetical protein
MHQLPSTVLKLDVYLYVQNNSTLEL